MILLGSAGVSFAGPETHDHNHRRGEQERHDHREGPPIVHVPPVTNAPRALPPPIGQTFSRPESTFARPSSTFSRPPPPAIGVAPGLTTETESRRHEADLKQPSEKPRHGHHPGRGSKERHHRRHKHHIVTYYPFDPYYYFYDQQLQEPPPETTPPAQEAAPAEEKPETAPPVVIDLPPGARIIKPAAPPAAQPSPAKAAPGE